MALIRRRRKHDRSDRKSKQVSSLQRRRLLFEELETRNMMSVSIDPTNQISGQTFTTPDGTYLYVPLNASESDSSASVTWNVSSSDPSLSPTILQNNVSGSVETLQLNVSGTTGSGGAFSGTIDIQLFGTLAPNTVAHIESLVNSDFYNSEEFFRVIDGFIAQAGSQTNNGEGGSSEGPIFDEYTPELLFNDSPGLVAMADSGHNTDDSQFFLMDPQLTSSYQSEGDYNYTIFGQITSGFDIVQDIMGTQVTTNSSGEDSQPVDPITISSATIINDDQNAVMQVYIPAGYTGTPTFTVNATDSDGDVATPVTFTVAGTTNTVADTPFFNPPFGQSAPFTLASGSTTPTLSTQENTPISFTVPITDTNVGATLEEQLQEYDSSTGDYTTATDATATYYYEATSSTTGNLTVTITPTTGFDSTADLQLEIYDNEANNSGGPDYENFTLAVATNPVITTDVELSTSFGQTSTITSSLLNTTETGVAPANLTYTLSSIPADGNLEDNGTVLASGDTFTQADIDNGLITFVNSGTTATTDTFGFTVTDTSGNSTPAATYAIQINTADVPPTLTTNNGLTLVQGTTATISTSDLQVTDSDKQDAQLTYTIVTAPTNGTLEDNGVPLDASSTFTEADIDDGLLTYANTSGTTDSFVFTVSDDDGGSIGDTTFNITVTGRPATPTSVTLDSNSNTGDFTGFDYTSDDTPQIDITAATGGTVTIYVNGSTTAAATTTDGSSSGSYTAVLPAGTLAVGVNSIVAVVTVSGVSSEDSTALSITYAPNFAEVYTVPGPVGTAETLDVDWVSRSAAYNDEVGWFTVSSLSGTVSGIAPGASGYAQAAVTSTSQVIFPSGDQGGETATLSVTGGQLIVFYMVQNASTADFLANNPSDSISGGPLIFFTDTAANPDGFQHVQVVQNQTTGQVQYNWEDMTDGGDKDFNDVVMTVGLAATPSGISALQVPGGGSGNTVNIDAMLLGNTSLASAPGDVGFYYVTNASGDVNGIAPGSPGYAAAALASGNYQVLFGPGAGTGNVASDAAPAGSLIAFYSISSGTTANFLTANSANSSSGGPVAFFSFTSANPDSTDHFRFFSPEGVATNPSQVTLHLMDTLFGNDSDYDSLAMSLTL